VAESRKARSLQRVALGKPAVISRSGFCLSMLIVSLIDRRKDADGEGIA
jgi:hypothetical protein